MNSAGLKRIFKTLWLISAIAVSTQLSANTQEKVLATAGQLLELAQISYVYGGSRLGDGEKCNTCNVCLETNNPDPKKRLVACPVCADCSLDCSHFIELVYRLAGAPYPYLDTKLMIALTGDRLRRNYNLEDLESRIDLAQPGDLFVYEGHVVILERLHGKSKGEFRGDIVHATGGKDIRLPGQGIQRERFVELRYFRGSLRRILRHVKLMPGQVVKPLKEADRTGPARLRPVR